MIWLFAALLAAAPLGAADDDDAPRGPCKVSPVAVTVWPEHGPHDCAQSFFGLGLPRARSGELRGLQLGLASAEVDRDALGVQVAGLSAVAGGDATGLQLSGLANVTGERFRGLRLAGLANVSGDGSTALELAGLANVSGERARGVFLSGLANVSGNAGRGVFLSGLANVGGDGASGIYLSGLANVSGEGARGLFVSGLANVSGSGANGLFVSGLANVSGSGLRGLQAGGLANVAGGGGAGAQLSALANVSGGRFYGLQLSGLGNVTRDLRGLQLSAGANYLDQGAGAQIAALYNRSRGDLAGAQIALVNLATGDVGGQVGLVNVALARSRFQLGLVNVAHEVDAPVGPVSWVRGGPRQAEIWASDAVPVQAALRLGNGQVYSLLALGVRPNTLFSGGAGTGLHLPLAGRLSLDTDALAQLLLFDDARGGNGFLGEVRGRLSWSFASHFALFAGVAWNLFVSGTRDGHELSPGPALTTHHLRTWPGLLAGVTM